MKKITVYVIRSIEGYRYTGFTEDLGKRLEQHNNKTLSFWTKRGSGWKLFYKEEFNSKADAMEREKWLKTGKGREFLNNIKK